MAKAKAKKLEIPVEFGGVSIGKATARLGINVARSNLTLESADEIFVGHRLTCRITLDRQGEANGQKALPGVGDANHRIDAVCDVKGIGANADTIRTGLTFSLADIDIAELAKFSKGEGKLIVSNVAEIPAEEKAGHGEGLDEADESEEE